MKNYMTLFLIGLLNFVHGVVHLIQFAQSMLLASYSAGEGSWVHELMENPWMGALWASVGMFSLFLGYRDFRHHRQKGCHDHKDPAQS